VKTRLVVPFALCAAISLLALAAGGPAYAASVTIGDNFYTPETVTIKIGEAVTWTNNGQAPHTVTANDNSFDSSPNCPKDINECLHNGETYSHTFGAVGTFAYHCKVHGLAMSGTVVVLGVSPPPTSEPSATVTALPNTGPSIPVGRLTVFGLLFLVAGGGLLLALRRRRA
jgi:LPXTG-motif cell wall-anchored protein